jgi:hypothetical protein
MRRPCHCGTSPALVGSSNASHDRSRQWVCVAPDGDHVCMQAVHSRPIAALVSHTGWHPLDWCSSNAQQCQNVASHCCYVLRFRHEDFYPEVRRILKPLGTFAAWTYSLPIINHRQHPAQVITQQPGFTGELHATTGLCVQNYCLTIYWYVVRAHCCRKCMWLHGKQWGFV